MNYAIILCAVFAVFVLTACADTPQEADTPAVNETGPTGQVIVDDINSIFAEDAGTILPPAIPDA
ncbi:MAG: hypothetical protein ABIJ21_09330 [Nanoarchaeota archaeon]